MHKNIHELATQLSQALIKDTRLDGTEFYHLKDESPPWMLDVIHEVHGDRGPDDTVYEFISQAAAALSDADPDTCYWEEVIEQMDPDIYTHDLTTWLHRRVDHVSYLTDALCEYGPFDDGFALLQAAQRMHIEEVAYALLAALREFEDEDIE